MVRWLAFKSDMDTLEVSEIEASAMIEAARATFRAVAELSDDLLEPLAV